MPDLTQPCQTTGDYHAQDLACPLVYLGDLGVTEIALQWQLLAVTYAAVNLDGFLCYESGSLTGEQLGHACFQRVS